MTAVGIEGVAPEQIHEEATMHPTVLQEIVRLHIADLLAEADRWRQVRQARLSTANSRRRTEDRYPFVSRAAASSYAPASTEVL